MTPHIPSTSGRKVKNAFNPDTMHVTGVGVCMYVRVSVHVCHKECADH